MALCAAVVDRCWCCWCWLLLKADVVVVVVLPVLWYVKGWLRCGCALLLFVGRC